MKNKIFYALAIAAGLMSITPPPASAEVVQSLRLGVGIDEPNDPPKVMRQDTSGRFDKAYRQQPPLIPHKISRYQINKKVNQCLRCHDWPNNVQENAPKISETHYRNREGVALDQVARTRWSCTQCHVPQVNAPALVGNTFTPAKIKH